MLRAEMCDTLQAHADLASRLVTFGLEVSVNSFRACASSHLASQLSKSVVAYASDVRSTKEAFELSTMRRFVREATEACLGVQEEVAWSESSSILDGLCKGLVATLQIIQDAESSLQGSSFVAILQFNPC